MFIRYLLAFLFIVSSCSSDDNKIQPEERELVESVYTSVIVLPDSLYQVYAVVAGIIDNNLVDEGDKVNKNQEIIEIINHTPKLNSMNAKLALDQAFENYNGSSAILKSMADEIAAARLKLNNDSVNFFRQKNLWDRNIGSKIQFDAKKLNYELSRSNLGLLRSKYRQTESELKTKLKQAKNTYQNSLLTTEDFTIKSNMKGKVYALYKEPGEIVNNMEPLASIGSTNNFIIEMLVDEVDIVRVKEKQPVIITLDAYPGEAFNGVVSKIFPKKDERNQTFKVEAEFRKTPEVLYPGLSGEANIIVAKKDKVLTIPRAYLNDKSEVKTDTGMVTIETGLENMEFVEVLSGITKQTRIYKLNK